MDPWLPYPHEFIWHATACAWGALNLSFLNNRQHEEMQEKNSNAGVPGRPIGIDLLF
jgi:hypothetical protein